MLITQDINRMYRFILSFVLTAILTGGVMLSGNSGSGYLAFLDSLITGEVQGREQGYKQFIYGLASFLGSPKMDILWVLIIAFLLWGFKYKIPALWALFTLFSGDVIGTVLKHVVGRARPVLHSAADTGYSYPSGHVLGTVLVISIVWVILIPMLSKRNYRIIARTVACVYVALVMLSRAFLNAHYPSDVLGAFLVAFTWFQFCEWLYYRYASRLTQIKRLSNSIY